MTAEGLEATNVPGISQKFFLKLEILSVIKNENVNFDQKAPISRFFKTELRTI